MPMGVFDDPVDGPFEWTDDEGRQYVGGAQPPPPRGTPSRAATDAVIQSEFADQLADMLGDDGLGVTVPQRPGQPAQRVVPFDEENPAFPEVRAKCGKSTFPVKQALKTLGCRWSQKRNAWIAPDQRTQAQGQAIADSFWHRNPNHDPWTLEGDPQPVAPTPTRKRSKKHPMMPDKVHIEVIDEITGVPDKVSAAFTAVHMAQAVAQADDVHLVRELERRGYTVRKIPESELLREALEQEGETGSHLLAATDDIFNELEQEDEE